MHPLEILLGTLAAVPAVVLAAIVVNLTANNIIETRATAREYPKSRTHGAAK